LELANQKGVKQGLEQGITQGIKQGIKQGIAQGVTQGIEQGKVAMVKALLLKGVDLELIAQVSGFSQEEIAKIQQTL